MNWKFTKDTIKSINKQETILQPVLEFLDCLL